MHIEIRDSPIHGKGVFAAKFLEKNEWSNIYGYVKEYVPGDPCIQYAFEYGDNDVFVPYAPWCYLNHSDKPNCECVDTGGEFWIRIKKRIRQDEELTIDYGDKTWKHI